MVAGRTSQGLRNGRSMEEAKSWEETERTEQNIHGLASVWLWDHRPSLGTVNGGPDSVLLRGRAFRPGTHVASFRTPSSKAPSETVRAYCVF